MFHDKRKGELTKVSNILERSFNYGSLHFVGKKMKIIQIWSKITGDMAKKTKLDYFHEGHLVVSVSEPAYVERYQYMASELKQQLNTELGEDLIAEILFQFKTKNSRNGKS